MGINYGFLDIERDAKMVFRIRKFGFKNSLRTIQILLDKRR
jgi:hypothetical protein